MRLTAHVRILAIAVAAWAAFLVGGLPDYYQQYATGGMVLFCLALVPPIIAVASKVIGRAPQGRRRTLAVWLAFYFTVPLAVLDYAYCGVYLGHGLGFLSRYWYLTVYYVIPWMVLIPIGYRSARAAPPRIDLARWMYRGGHPNRVAAVLNRCWALVHGLGVAPDYLVTLEVPGRRSGRVISLPLVMAVVAGERYLVSMLGAEAEWVRNATAAGGNVTLRHGGREEVHLEDVPAESRAPILKAYLQRAPGARPHLPVDKDAPLAEFARVSSQFPVFRVAPRSDGRGT